MKRVIALVLLLSGVMALFAFNVSAVSWKGSASDTDQVGDVIMDTHVYALNYEDYDNTNHPYKFTLYVTVRLQNTDSDEPAYISQPRFTISPGDGVNSSYVSIENYSVDLMLSVDGGIITLSCDDQFSYGSGIVIPPNSSLYAIGKVELAANSFSWTPSVANATFTSTTSSVYPYGQHIDYSPIIDYLNNAATHLDINNVLTVLSQFYLRNHDDIQDIIDLITYTGSNYVQSVDSSSYYYSGNLTANATDFTYSIRRTVTRSYYEDIDVEYDSSNDTNYVNGTKAKYVYLRIQFNNDSDNYVRFNRVIPIDNFFPGGNSTYEIIDFNKDIISSVYPDADYIGNRRIYISFINNFGNQFYIPPHRSLVIYIMTKYHYSGTDISFNNPSLALTAYNVTGDFYYPLTEYDILRDIYSGISSSQSNNISNDSSTLNQTESQVHQQEQLYFQQNAQAILDTGLSNYRFNTEQSNGIGVVSIDFTQLWNALGSWNSVYIFALTLTIALTILRHAPNAISTARRRNYDHNERGS